MWHMCTQLVASNFFWSAEMQKKKLYFFVLLNRLPNEIGLVIYNCKDKAWVTNFHFKDTIF